MDIRFFHISGLTLWRSCLNLHLKGRKVSIALSSLGVEPVTDSFPRREQYWLRLQGEIEAMTTLIGVIFCE